MFISPLPPPPWDTGGTTIPRPPPSVPPSTHSLLQNLPGLEPFVRLRKRSQVPVVLMSLHGAVPTGPSFAQALRFPLRFSLELLSLADLSGSLTSLTLLTLRG